MKRTKRLIVAVTALIVLIGAVSLGWNYYGKQHDNNGHLVLLGNIDVRQVNLAFKVGGRIATMHVEEGDFVEIGRLVASLEKEDLQDEFRLTQARAKAQSAALTSLETGTRPEEIEQARAFVAERQATLENARRTLARQETLAARGYTPHLQHDDAIAAVGEAEARLKFAQKTLKLAEIGPRQEDIEQARAQLNADKAALSLAKRRLADTDLFAPNEGIILTRVREPGAIVTAGETIYTLTLISPVWVRTYVSGPDLGRIHLGMAAEVYTDARTTYRGQIGFISPVAEFTPKTVETRELRTSLVYRLRVIVANPDNRLKQGMPVTVVLKPNEKG
jgi:HlyD family secretion protein